VRNAGRLGFDESRVLGRGVTRTHALESLVISSFLRDLSMRDVEAALEEVFEEPISSKASCSVSMTEERRPLPGFHAGRSPRNKGMRYPAGPPIVEEIIAAVHKTRPDDVRHRRLTPLKEHNTSNSAGGAPRALRPPADRNCRSRI
jgi:hypothetical protein